MTHENLMNRGLSFVQAFTQIVVGQIAAPSTP